MTEMSRAPVRTDLGVLAKSLDAVATMCAELADHIRGSDHEPIDLRPRLRNISRTLAEAMMR